MRHDLDVVAALPNRTPVLELKVSHRHIVDPDFTIERVSGSLCVDGAVDVLTCTVLVHLQHVFSDGGGFCGLHEWKSVFLLLGID